MLLHFFFSLTLHPSTCQVPMDASVARHISHTHISGYHSVRLNTDSPPGEFKVSIEEEGGGERI